jgi:hypothetical protein
MLHVIITLHGGSTPLQQVQAVAAAFSRSPLVLARPPPLQLQSQHEGWRSQPLRHA